MRNHPKLFCALVAALLFFRVGPSATAADNEPQRWKIGTPIVTYWAGPPMSEAVAQQMKDGGFNVVWCGEKDFDLLQKLGLRGMLHDPLLTPATLETPAQVEKLDALIERHRTHPAMYSYFLTDEPSAANFPALGKLIAHLRQRDPAHLAYVNLFPTYATKEQLGTKGDVATAYKEYLKGFVDVVKPDLISYDHYQFMVGKDLDQYFLNLAMVRTAAQDAGVPFLNIIQAAAWQPGVRVPNADETRYLVYTSLAYGAQGISYYVYNATGHKGGIARDDGTPTPIYATLEKLNPEFVAIATELQPLRSLGVYHTTMREAGCLPLPADAAFHPAPVKVAGELRGLLLGNFGASEKPTHVVIVNLDYTKEIQTTIVGPKNLEVFDAATAKWTPANAGKVNLKLPPGGGTIVRIGK